MPRYSLTLKRPSLRACIKVGLWTLASPVIALVVIAILGGLMYLLFPSLYDIPEPSQRRDEAATESSNPHMLTRPIYRPARKDDQHNYQKVRWP
jgi:hypothetical protein